MSENDFIKSVKKSNPTLFATDSIIKIKASSLEDIMRKSFQAGRLDLPESRESRSLFEMVFGK
jgi:hypothetical protein